MHATGFLKVYVWETLLEVLIAVERGWSVELGSSQSYRGLHRVDPSKCTGCGLCALECPSEAIQMKVLNDSQKSMGRLKRLPVIHYYLCIFCYHCVDVCPRKAYITSNKPPKPVEKKEKLVGDPTGTLAWDDW